MRQPMEWGYSHTLLSVKGQPSNPQHNGHSPYLNVNISHSFPKSMFINAMLAIILLLLLPSRFSCV